MVDDEDDVLPHDPSIATMGRPAKKCAVPCPHCRGTGQPWWSRGVRNCLFCKGKGVIKDQKTLKQARIFTPGWRSYPPLPKSPHWRGSYKGALIAQAAKPAPTQPAEAAPMKCRECGCTDNDCSGCIDRTGEPCFWVEADLCSACVAAKVQVGT